LIAFVLGVMFLLGTTSVRADEFPENYQPQILPHCQMYNLPGGEVVCGYESITQWKLVLKADAELLFLRAKVRLLENLQIQLKQQLGAIRGQQVIAANEADMFQKENDRLTKELIALDKKYQEERVKPQWGSPVAWSIAGVSTAILLGVMINSLMD
jgi:hypothetical protein